MLYSISRLRQGRGAAFLLAVGVLIFGGCSAPRAGFEAMLAAPALPADVARAAPALDAVALERAIHDLVNEVREENGLSRLGWSADLADLARTHSLDMAEHRFFDHVNLRGEDPGARAVKAGLIEEVPLDAYSTEGIGENLFVTHLYAEYSVIRDEDGGATYVVDWKGPRELAVQAVQGWMRSQTHRANLLSPYYDAAAIGVVRGDQDVVFVTQNFHGRAHAYTAGLPD